MTRFAFTIAATDGAARTGSIAMQRGTIRTPAFMPVGTAATVKGLRPAEVRAAGADIILGNTYHLMLRPGAERIARLGGLHAFMGWDRPILTDSGGYQVMSLSALTKRIRGRRRLRQPSRRQPPHDEPRTLDGNPAAARLATSSWPSMNSSRSRHRARWSKPPWRDRCAGRRAAGPAFDSAPEHAGRAALFGIQQGGLDERLRAESASALQAIGFDGYAIGGLAVGEGQEAMFGVLDYACDQLPAARAALPDGRRQAR